MNADAQSRGTTLTLRLRSLWTLVHPGPSLATTLAYAALALLAARGHPALLTFLATIVGMAALQFAISAFNDFRDRKADVHSQKFKPIALGILAPRVALIATAVFTVIMIACYAPYGPAPLGIASAFLVLGFAYDLGLKATPLGALLMGAAFSLLPLLAWTLFASAKPALFWMFPIGLALGAAIHIADALPDLSADRAAGARTLAQTLGRSALATECALLTVAALLPLALAALGWTAARRPVLTTATSLALALVVASGAISRSTLAGSRKLRLNFIVTVITALVIGVGWVASAIV